MSTPTEQTEDLSNVHNNDQIENSGTNNTEAIGNNMEFENEQDNVQESLVRQTQGISLDPNISSASVAKVKTTKGVLKDLENTRAQLVQRYTDGFKEESPLEERDAELINKIDSITKHIETLKRAMKESDNPGFKIQREDLPRFQLKYQKDVPFPNKPQFVTVNQFLREFEKVLESGGYNAVVDWKKFIPLTLSLDLDSWLTEDLLICETWVKAKTLFQKKFGNSFMKVEARRTVFNMRMRSNETIKEYYIRFTKSTSEAGYKKNDTILGDVYYNSLPINWQTQIGTVLITRGINEDNYTIDDITEATNSIHGDKTPKDVPGTVVIPEINDMTTTKKKRKQDSSDNNYNKAKRRNTNTGGDYFCSEHGGNKANHNEEDCFSNKNKPKFLERRLHSQKF